MKNKVKGAALTVIEIVAFVVALVLAVIMNVTIKSMELLRK